MRILQVHNRYRSSSPSGENRVVDNEAAGLELRGHQVERFERHSDEIQTWPITKKARLAAGVLWSAESYRGLIHALRESRPDVVHVHNLFPLLSPSVLDACASERVPVVVTLHNYRLVCAAGNLFRNGAICHDCVGRRPLPAIVHGCYRDSTLATIPVVVAEGAHRHAWRTLVSAYVCLSKSQRQILTPLGLPDERVFIKSNLVPYTETAEAPSTERDTVVFTGRIDKVKGIRLLMEAWDRYVSQPREGALRLVIAGSGPLQADVTAWARGRPDVTFAGLLSHQDCAALLSSARAAVVPSEWEEPFGLVVVEAMAAGVPVIAAAHGSFPEMLVDGVEGTLFESGRSDALAKVLRDVEDTPERYERYGRNARLAYENRFNPDDNVRELVSIYEFAMAHPVWDRRVAP